MLQQTISKCLTFRGVGLHSGVRSSIRLMPALKDTGIRFHLNGAVIPADFRYVEKPARMCTTLLCKHTGARVQVT